MKNDEKKLKSFVNNIQRTGSLSSEAKDAVQQRSPSQNQEKHRGNQEFHQQDQPSKMKAQTFPGKLVKRMYRKDQGWSVFTRKTASQG